MSDKDHNGDMVNLLGPKKAKQVKSAGVKTKTYMVSKDRWVLASSICILLVSIFLVSFSGVVTKATQADIKQAMYTYEQQIFQKKIQIYREEFRVKGVQLDERNNRIELLEKELREAYQQVSFANMQLMKASRMVGSESLKLRQLDSANKDLSSRLAAKSKAYDGLKNELKYEKNENAGYKKTNSQIEEEERQLNKLMRGKDARIEQLESDLEDLTTKLTESGESFQTIKLQLEDLQLKEKLEAEEIEILKEAITQGIDSTQSDLEKQLKELSDALGDGDDNTNESTDSDDEESGDETSDIFGDDSEDDTADDGTTGDDSSSDAGSNDW